LLILNDGFGAPVQAFWHMAPFRAELNKGAGHRHPDGETTAVGIIEIFIA
jgi:hypothetical protein